MFTQISQSHLLGGTILRWVQWAEGRIRELTELLEAWKSYRGCVQVCFGSQQPQGAQQLQFIKYFKVYKDFYIFLAEKAIQELH